MYTYLRSSFPKLFRNSEDVQSKVFCASMLYTIDVCMYMCVYVYMYIYIYIYIYTLEYAIPELWTALLGYFWKRVIPLWSQLALKRTVCGKEKICPPVSDGQTASGPSGWGLALQVYENLPNHHSGLVKCIAGHKDTDNIIPLVNRSRRATLSQVLNQHVLNQHLLFLDKQVSK